MKNSKEIFLDKSLSYGGFYELAIQVCPSADNTPIKLYTEYIWTLDNVEGPYDNDFNLILPDAQNTQHKGIIHLENYIIPFLTYNIREEEPVESGFNWFDICFYTEAIQKIFGTEYQTWSENPQVPSLLNAFFRTTIKNLYKIHPFLLAIQDFEVSGQHYLDDLKNDLAIEWSPKFYIGKEDFFKISENNRKFVTIVETPAGAVL